MRLTPALALSSLVSALVLAACSSGTPKPSATPTPSIADVQVFTGLSHTHLKKGQLPQSYDQSPPVGGRHSAAWLKCQVYDVEVPKESAVHSEEHGGIWLTYQPGLATAQVATLTALAQTNKEFVLVSPYKDQSSPVVISTWGLQLQVQSADDPRLLEFIRTYAGGAQGGEKGVGCTKTGATLQQAQDYNASLR